MSPHIIARVLPRITAEPDPALPLALAWAGEDEDRWQSDVLAAFVALVHVCDEMQRQREADRA